MRPVGANILICKDEEAVAVEAAERFACAAVRCVAVKESFFVAIPGGWSPRKAYEVLAGAAFDGLVPWDRTHVFFTDERCVPPDHEESNYRLAMDLLLSHVPIPKENIHRFPTEFPPDEAAERYAEDIRALLGDRPRFDLVLLGMGKDTHTASLFPHSPALLVRDRIAVPNEVDGLGTTRLTLTVPVLCDAENVVILALGSEKAPALRKVLHEEPNPALHPVQAVQPVAGRLLWIVDREAAAEL